MHVRLDVFRQIKIDDIGHVDKVDTARRAKLGLFDTTSLRLRAIVGSIRIIIVVALFFFDLRLFG